MHPIRLGGGLLLVVPLLVATVFVMRFAGPLPLTDEWTYTHALRQLSDVNPTAPGGWDQFRQLLPLKHNEHWVILPFAFYWPVAELSGFDARWAVGLTLAAFGLQALAYARAAGGSPWVLGPVALLLYCPSHYMEFMWGWQFTLTLSALLPLAGLVGLAGLPPQPSGRTLAWRLGGGISCFLLGTLSSAGGFFGFPAGLLLMALLRLDLRPKIIGLAALALAGTLTYWFLMRGGTAEPVLGLRQVWYVLTALGGALLGSPVGLLDFGFDRLSALGLVAVVLTGGVIVRAILVRQVSALALPLAFAAYGYLCVIPIGMVRPYLGNWHLQYILPALCGGYLAAWTLRREDDSALSRALWLAWLALMGSCLWGYQQGFRQHGPDYARYIDTIEAFAWDRLAGVDRPSPYPPQAPKRELDLQLLLFLAAKGNPLFADVAAATPARAPLPTDARLFLGDREVQPPLSTDQFSGRNQLLTVVLPGGDAAPVGIEASAGHRTLRLWAVHEGHAPATARTATSPTVGARHYMGLWLGAESPTAATPLVFQVVN